MHDPSSSFQVLYRRAVESEAVASFGDAADDPGDLGWIVRIRGAAGVIATDKKLGLTVYESRWQAGSTALLTVA